MTGMSRREKDEMDVTRELPHFIPCEGIGDDTPQVQTVLPRRWGGGGRGCVGVGIGDLDLDGSVPAPCQYMILSKSKDQRMLQTAHRTHPR